MLVKIWNVLWPLLIYMIAQIVATIFGTFVMMIVSSFKNSNAAGMVGVDVVVDDVMSTYNEYAILFLLIAALVCIPIYYRMHKNDCEKAGEVKRNIPIGNKDYVAIILCGAALAIAMNNIINITPLPYLFTGYEETNEVLFGGSIILQILAGGIFGCIVEEISLRGVTYRRMRRYWGTRRALIFSAIVFGIYHMNVVQAVYAFFLGLFFAWVYERYDSLWAPITAHMSANLFVIIFGSSEVMNNLLGSLVGFCLITCISILIFYYGCRFMKQTNPLVELQFVEKEPDTLEKLTEEYYEQEREEP